MVFWKYTGFNIVLYTTGLMTIPKDILEAARMDGANAFRRFWNISLPMIRPFIFFAITMTIIGNLQMFEEPFVLNSWYGWYGPIWFNYLDVPLQSGLGMVRNGHSICYLVVTVCTHRDLYIGSIFTLR